VTLAKKYVAVPGKVCHDRLSTLYFR
jgi:hypothetical protein